MRLRYNRYSVVSGLQKIKTRTAIAVTAAGLIISGGTGLAITQFGTAHAAATSVVLPGDPNWTTVDTTAGGQVNFVSDSSTPTGLGTGALQLVTDSTSTAKASDMNYSNPTNLSDVTDLSYWTKQNSASFAGGDPSYQLAMYLNGNSGFTTLVYEPYQNPAQGTVTNGTWQNWDVYNGLFWSTHSITCSNGTINGATGGPATYTLAQVKTACPDAVVLGFGVNIGSNNPSYDVETDGVAFNDTTYNFEPAVTPQGKNDCMNGGWQNSNSPAFSNQGQCVSWVNHNVLGHGN